MYRGGWHKRFRQFVSLDSEGSFVPRGFWARPVHKNFMYYCLITLKFSNFLKSTVYFLSHFQSTYAVHKISYSVYSRHEWIWSTFRGGCTMCNVRLGMPDLISHDGCSLDTGQARQ